MIETSNVFVDLICSRAYLSVGRWHSGSRVKRIPCCNTRSRSINRAILRRLKLLYICIPLPRCNFAFALCRLVTNLGIADIRRHLLYCIISEKKFYFIDNFEAELILRYPPPVCVVWQLLWLLYGFTNHDVTTLKSELLQSASLQRRRERPNNDRRERDTNLPRIFPWKWTNGKGRKAGGRDRERERGRASIKCAW